MLSDGIYGLTFERTKRRKLRPQPAGEALAVLRGGVIFGSDPWGGVFSGTCAQCPATGAQHVHLLVTVPPDGELVTGFAAGPDGALVDVDTAFRDFVRAATARVRVAGKTLRVQVAYLGPLPDSGCVKAPS